MNRPSSLTSRTLLFACLAAVSASGCAALLDTALGAAQKTFLSSADKNYGSQYHDDVDKLLKTLVAKQETPPPPAAPAAGTTTTTTTTTTEPPPVSPPVAGQPPPVVAAPVALGPFELEVVLLKQELIGERAVRVPVRDGDTLFDGHGAHGDGDPFKISFRVSQECFVYVIGIDSTAFTNPIFPNPKYSAHVNPAQPGVSYEIPEGDGWLGLDSYQGIEHVYFLASRTRRLDLEAQLTAMSKSAPRPLDPSRASPGQALAAVETVRSRGPLTRGIGEVRQGLMPSGQAGATKSDPVPSQVFGAKGEGDILVTRWFRHE